MHVFFALRIQTEDILYKCVVSPTLQQSHFLNLKVLFYCPHVCLHSTTTTSKRSKALKHPTSQLCHQNKQTIFYLQIILLVPNGFTHGIQDVFVKSGLTTLARPCMCTPEVETINSLVQRDEMCVCSTKHLPSGLLVKAIIVLTLPPSVTLSLYKNLTCTYSSTISIPLIV